VVKGDLDREKLETYTLVIVARDGGTPPRTGSLTLKVNVQVRLQARLGKNLVNRTAGFKKCEELFEYQ
jgi:hypothetical protein